MQRKLTFQSLEPRLLLSADLAPVEGVLEVIGTNESDLAFITRLAQEERLVVDLNGEVFEFDLADIREIKVDLLGGDDVLALDGSSGALPAVQIDLGEGDNQFKADLLNPVGALSVVAGSGDDMTSAHARWSGGSVDNHPDFLWAPSFHTGAGDDVVDFSALMGVDPEPFLPAIKLEATIDTGEGNDVVGIDSVSGGASSEAVYRVRVGEGDNKTSLRFGDGAQGARLPTGESRVSAEYRSGEGADTVSVQYTMFLDDGTPTRARTLDLDILTGGGNDTVEVETAQAEPGKVAPNAGLDIELKLNAGAGDDVVRSNVYAIWLTVGFFEIDAGAGNDRLGFDADGNRMADGAALDWSFLGGDGHDVLDVRAANAMAGDDVHWRWLTDGGAGDDFVKVHIDEVHVGERFLADWSVQGGLGNDGIDFVRCGMSIAAGARYAWALDAGEGNDGVDVMLQDLAFGADSDVKYNWSLGAGHDRLEATTSNVSLAASTAFALQIDAGDGDDLVRHELTHVVLQGDQLPPSDNKPAEFRIAAGAGDDVVDFRAVMGIEPEPFAPLIDLEILAGDGDDSVQVALLLPAVQAAREAANRVNVRLGAGDDKALVDIAADVTPCWDIGVDAGLGDDHVTVNASGSFDEILIGLLLGGGNDVAQVDIATTNVAAGITPCYDIDVDAGLGSDQVSVDARGAFEEFELSVDLGARATGNDVAIETLSLNFEKIDVENDDTASSWIRVSQLASGGGMGLALGGGAAPALALDVQGGEGDDHVQAEILGFADVSVNVDTQGGNDSIWLDLGAPVDVQEPVTRRLSLSGGEGDDSVRAGIRDGTSNTFMIGEVRGGAGDDGLEVAFSGESGGADLVIDAGDGDDAVMFNPTEFTLSKSADWETRIDTGDGDDELTVQTSNVHLGAQSRVEWLYEMGAGDDDVTHIRANWEIDAGADYRWGVNLGEGDDAFKASVAGQSVGDAASVAYKFSGGGGDDAIEVSLKNLALDDGAAFTMSTDAGDGDDLVRHEVAHIVQQTGGAQPLLAETEPAEFKVDTGSGRDTLIVSMGGGAPVTASFKNVEGQDSETEVVEFQEGDDADVRKKPGRIALKGVEALTLETGAGDDRITIEVSDPAAAVPALDVRTGAGDDTVLASWNFENAWPAKWSGPAMKASSGAGDDLVSIFIDASAVDPALMPAANLAIDAGLGGDAVKVDAKGAFRAFDLSVDLGADAGSDVPVETLTLNFEEVEFEYHAQSEHTYRAKGEAEGAQAHYNVGLRSDGELVQAVYDVETIGGLIADHVNVEIGASLSVSVGNDGEKEADGELAAAYSLDAAFGGAEGTAVAGDVRFKGGSGANRLTLDLSANETPTRAGFSEVSGLGSEVTPVEYRAGAEMGDRTSLKLDMAGVDAFDLISGDADDEIDIDLVYPTVPVPALAFTTQGGDDTIRGSFLGAAGALKLALDTGDGNDHIDLAYAEASTLVTGAGGPPHVKTFSGASATEVDSFFAYSPQFSGGVRVATGDVNNDGVADIVTGAGPGGGPHVKVFDGRTGDELRSFFAYDPGFAGGVYVAAGDVDNDGFADIITGAGAGGGPHVRVFSGATGEALSSFFAYSPSFTGGVRVAAGDVNNDGFDDIITGAGPGDGPHVKVFDGLTGAEARSFFAYDPGFLGGVFVAAGDVDGDGRADIVTGADAGGGPHVRVFSGADTTEFRSFFAYAPSFTGGVRVAAGDVNGDGLADIVTGAGPGAGPHVKVFDGRTGDELRSFFAYAPSFTGGVYVAAGDLTGDVPSTFDLSLDTGAGSDDVALRFDTGGSRSDHIDADLGDGADRFALRWSGALQEPSVELLVDVHVDPGGSGFLPEIGDEVLVSFEHGDVNRPIVIGTLWNSNDVPPPDDGQPPPDDGHLHMSLSSSGGVLRSTTELVGGAGHDSAQLFFQGKLKVVGDQQLSAMIDLGGGADSLTITFTGLETEGAKKFAPIWVDARGGTGRDTLAIVGTEGNDKFVLAERSVLLEGAANANFAGFELVQLRTLGGNDHVTASGLDPRIDWLVDGGADRDRFVAPFGGPFDNLTLLDFELVKFKKKG